jgi:hypothetical protein
LSAAQWFIAYLRDFEPRRINAVTARRKVKIWTDAAGVTRRLAAVLWTGERWLYTVYTVSQQLWDQFLPREDDQIGMQELLAVPLALHTFQSEVSGTEALCFGDNDGVVASLIKGSNKALDTNLCVGQIWLDVNKFHIALVLARVESKANVADDPSRDRFEFLNRVGASFIEPVMPQWVDALWAFPVAQR